MSDKIISFGDFEKSEKVAREKRRDPEAPEKIARRAIPVLEKQALAYLKTIPRRYRAEGRKWAKSWEVYRLARGGVQIGNSNSWSDEFEYGILTAKNNIPPSFLVKKAFLPSGIINKLKPDV